MVLDRILLWMFTIACVVGKFFLKKAKKIILSKHAQWCDCQKCEKTLIGFFLVFFLKEIYIYILFLFYRHSLYHHGCTKPLWLKKTNWCSVFQNWSKIRFNDHAEKHWKGRFFWPTRIISQQKILKKPLINNPFARASSKQKQTKKQIMTTSKIIACF